MSSATPPVVLIHGLWMTGRSWEAWAERYRAAGHQVVDTGWPGVDADPEVVRRDPSALSGLRTAEILDHYAAIIAGLSTPPIVMGHSFGGTFTQVLLAEASAQQASPSTLRPSRGSRSSPSPPSERRSPS